MTRVALIKQLLVISKHLLFLSLWALCGRQGCKHRAHNISWPEVEKNTKPGRSFFVLSRTGFAVVYVSGVNSVLFLVSGCQYQCSLGKLVSEMTYYVSSEMLNITHSFLTNKFTSGKMQQGTDHVCWGMSVGRYSVSKWCHGSHLDMHMWSRGSELLADRDDCSQLVHRHLLLQHIINTLWYQQQQPERSPSAIMA